MDIQFLVDEARQSMLTCGNVMPMIYLELSQDVLMLALDILSDAQSIPAQCGILARLGWEECKKHPGQQPRTCGFYAEAWRVRDPESTEAKIMPVKSQKREEIIMVSFWQAESEPHVQSYALPVMRDHKKRVIDVSQEGPMGSFPYQHAAFLQGVLDSQRPDAEVFRKLDRAVGRRIATLSPEKRRELMEFLRLE
jgi:hypothetical protein